MGCGTHPINGWVNYDFNIFIFFAKIRILRKLLNRLTYIPDGYKMFMDQVIKENTFEAKPDAFRCRTGFKILRVTAPLHTAITQIVHCVAIIK